MTFEVATNIDDAFRACNPDTPLPAGDPRYTELSRVRGEYTKIIDSINRSINRSNDSHSKFVISGHRGCGKSTELLRLQKELLDERYFCVYFDVGEPLDLADISYIDVFISMVEAIVADLNASKIDFDAKYVETLLNWFNDKVINEQISQNNIDGGIKASAEVNNGLPLFAKIMASFTGEIKHSSTKRETIRREVEKKASEFILQINEFFSAVARTLHNSKGNKNYKDLVIITDGLEKIIYRNYEDGNNSHTDLFIKHADQLKALRCHVIYTMPISLAYQSNINHDFAQSHILPMVKMNEEGKNKLVELVGKRINIPMVFDNPALVNQLVDVCGGVTRDLMRLIRLATDTDEPKITQVQVDYAISTLAKEYDRLIKQSDIELLKKVYENNRVSIDDDRTNILLLNRIILEYENGQRSAKIHPALLKVKWITDALTINP